MLLACIEKVLRGEDLSAEEAKSAMREIMEGRADEIQTAAFLTALRMKGETASEISAFASVMRELALKIHPNVEKCVDVCGTGGDALNTFNISTASAFVTACFVPVAKHGNRSVTSKCGSADVLEALGVNLFAEPQKIKESIEKIGIGFMFAPAHHKAMKNVADVRKRLGFRTVFNILGPLTNPANATHQLIGVFSADLTEKIAEVLRILGLKRALVVHGSPGIDEVSICGKTKVSMLADGEIRTFFVAPEDFGFSRASPEEIAGGSVEENARMLRAVLAAEDEGARRDVVLLNAGAAIFAAEEADSLEEGVEMAKDALESGQALRKLDEFVKFNAQ
ncbi:MAG: Anthranilate phosphoribosyltransferase [Methanophagales archaeon]|nr:anthranilate phosphoribosyltransferase [Methanophagales archaeon]MCU4140137.1 Anthranilate phosphoribosyltransferase [Methanophagales archaeon]